ncbi:MAG: DUF2953 domain-containing protein [Pseudomonadota bacterium]
MLEGLLWILLGLVVFTLALLAVPIDVKAQLDLGARARCRLRIGWLFGLVCLEKDIGARTPSEPKKPKEKGASRGLRRPSLAVIRRGFRLLGELIHHVRVRHMELDLSLGTEDPASTGQLVGYAAPIVAMANAQPRTRVTLRPNFAGARLEGVGVGEICLVPIGLVVPVVGFALSPEVRRWLFAQP